MQNLIFHLFVFLWSNIHRNKSLVTIQLLKLVTCEYYHDVALYTTQIKQLLYDLKLLALWISLPFNLHQERVLFIGENSVKIHGKKKMKRILLTILFKYLCWIENALMYLWWKVYAHFIRCINLLFLFRLKILFVFALFFSQKHFSNPKHFHYMRLVQRQHSWWYFYLYTHRAMKISVFKYIFHEMQNGMEIFSTGT